jgi:hypothetical protein
VLRDAERFYRRLLLTGVGGARYVQANSSALSNEVARLRLEALREFREKVAEWIEDIESGGE